MVPVTAATLVDAGVTTPWIEYLEMVGVLLAVLTLRNHFSCRKMMLHCNNMRIVQAWQILGSSNRGVLDLM